MKEREFQGKILKLILQDDVLERTGNLLNKNKSAGLFKNKRAGGSCREMCDS